MSCENTKPFHCSADESDDCDVWEDEENPNCYRDENGVLKYWKKDPKFEFVFVAELPRYWSGKSCSCELKLQSITFRNFGLEKNVDSTIKDVKTVLKELQNSTYCEFRPNKSLEVESTIDEELTQIVKSLAEITKQRLSFLNFSVEFGIIVYSPFTTGRSSFTNLGYHIHRFRISNKESLKINSTFEKSRCVTKISDYIDNYCPSDPEVSIIDDDDDIREEKSADEIINGLYKM